MHAIEPIQRPLRSALALGPTLLARAERLATTHLAVSLVEDRAVVLGAVQRAGSVVELEACERTSVTVLRRSTTGTAAWIGGRALVVTLSLPHVAALLPDATPRTLLNRNVRPLLKGFTHAGVLAHYFGREWISLRKQPAALLGFDMAPSGAVLIEAFVGFDEPITLSASLTSEHERAIDRLGGKTAASIADLSPGVSPLEFARAFREGFVARVGHASETLALPPDAVDAASFQPITSALDPIPEGFVPRNPSRVPIGWLESALSLDGRHAWIGGDVLAPRFALEQIAHGEGPPPDMPIEGATAADLLSHFADRSS